MNDVKLHLFDLRLCRHALDNICCYLDNKGFAAYAEEHLHPAIWEYLQALDANDGPPALLLSDDDFDALVEVFQGGFDRPWVAYEPLYRKSIDCVREVRVGLAGAYAEEWASASARAARKLRHGRTRLSDGIRAIQGWVGEARRLLRAMAVPHFLPYPEGGSPTPTCPEPPQPSCPPTVETPIPEPRKDNSTTDAQPGLATTLSQLTDALNRITTSATSPMISPEALSKEHAAKFLGVSIPTIEHLIRTRKIEYVQLGSQRGRVIPVEALRKLVQNNIQLTGQEELRRRRDRR